MEGAQGAHIDSALELLTEFWLFAQDHLYPQTNALNAVPNKSFFLDQLNGFLLPQHRFGLATKNNDVVGCVALSELQNDSYSNACEMHCLFVKPQFRAQGFGHQLIEQALLWAHELNHSHLIFNPLGASESLRSIYSKFGFEEIPPLSHTNPSQSHLLMLELR
jgi:GNAT superfamily N-acetyltransferase